MAVTLTELAAALRLGDGSTAPVGALAGILTRLLGVADALVEENAPSCPVPIKDEAIIRLCAYLYDQPTSAPGNRYAAAWRNSGAEALVSRWVERRTADVEAP